jgi:hypothetical protein
MCRLRTPVFLISRRASGRLGLPACTRRAVSRVSSCVMTYSVTTTAGRHKTGMGIPQEPFPGHFQHAFWCEPTTPWTAFHNGLHKQRNRRPRTRQEGAIVTRGQNCQLQSRRIVTTNSADARACAYPEYDSRLRSTQRLLARTGRRDGSGSDLHVPTPGTERGQERQQVPSGLRQLVPHAHLPLRQVRLPGHYLRLLQSAQHPAQPLVVYPQSARQLVVPLRPVGQLLHDLQYPLARDESDTRTDSIPIRDTGAWHRDNNSRSHLRVPSLRLHDTVDFIALDSWRSRLDHWKPKDHLCTLRRCAPPPR